ncbi:MAG: PAS domain-containing protein, partial [Acidimicrobiia bacterium]
MRAQESSGKGLGRDKDVQGTNKGASWFAEATPDTILAAIVNSTDDAVIGKDPHGTICAWNPGAERLYGYPAEEVTGKSISILLPEDIRHEEEKIREQVLAGQQISHYQTQRITKSGEVIDVSLT